MKYGTKDGDYDAERYWGDRYKKHDLHLAASGRETKTDEENSEFYKAQADILLRLCNEMGISISNPRVLEIGCGAGYYTEIFHNLHPADLTCIDIADDLFLKLKIKFPNVHFVKKDISKELLEDTFDTIFMVNVIYNIVAREKFDFSMENVKQCLKKNGNFIIGPVFEKEKRKMFHLHYWSIDQVRNHFPDYLVSIKKFNFGVFLFIKNKSNQF
ncbi:MAG: Methyltransferase type 11 [Parcubacteria group bacterium GW2011_GWA2_38_13]|nr:MAG: Methyltransferase type 11 [Parcubacteria group bacterium GW2011_GWA2_38_13]